MHLIRICIAIEHPQFRAAMVQSLEQENDNFILITENDPNKLQATIQSNSITTLIIDTELKNPNILSLIRNLSTSFISIKIIVLTTSLHAVSVTDFIYAGASCVVPYSIDIDELILLLN